MMLLFLILNRLCNPLLFGQDNQISVLFSRITYEKRQDMEDIREAFNI